MEEVVEKAQETDQEAPQDSAVKEALIRDAKEVLSQREMTRAEAELTPEALKVKRAKAAYGAAGAVAPAPVIDVKAD